MTDADARVPRFPVVGLGASAGGIGALQTFFAAAPADAGVAWVVVQHLSPDTQSHLAEILGRATAMPVVEVSEDTDLVRDTVYVIVPDEALVLDGDGRLCIRAAGERPRHPVDRLFESLAERLGSRAIGIVLSGTGSNGSAGARAIKVADGAVFVQDPNEASHAGMPRATIAAGAADAVLPAAGLPGAVLAYAKRAVDEAPETPDEAVRRHLDEIVALLRSRLRRDFSDYKHGTLYRRVRRRMGLQSLDGFDAYRAVLDNDRDELEALAHDLLVSVTAFFRDEEAWEVLERAVVRPLVERAEPGAAIRAWTPGCATGEEAYSLAMLFLEVAEAAGKEVSLKVFATDPAEDALERARAGVFAGAIAEAMPPERLRRFFEREGEGYIAKPELRESIVFAPQNLLTDPPFSNLDIVCCRNLLIYLKSEAQTRVLGVFHFALREGGFLFLGAAESVGERSPMFEPVIARYRVYRRTGPAQRVRVVAERPGTLPPRPSSRGKEFGQTPSAAERTRAALVEAFAPPSVLVDHRLQALYFEGDIAPWLAQPPGEPTQDLVRLVRPGLAARLRAAADQALKTGRPARFDARPTDRADAGPVTMHVRPLSVAAGEDATRLLVSFVQAAPSEAVPGPAVALDESVLEEALRHSREELRQTIAQLESSNEALQASNEEISSINEEYQAANEELETSKEELQSLNEELNTVNSQLQNKVAELERRTSDLDNLLASTDVATLFLDRELRIRWFTPHMRALLSLEDTDRGRPVTDLAMHFEDDAFVADARAVLADFQPREREVEGAEERWFLRRALPYRASVDRVGGVVATFVDITGRRHAEDRLRESEARFRALVETSAAMVWTVDAEGRLAEDSPSWRAFTGQPLDRWLGEGWASVVHPSDREGAARGWHDAVARGAALEAEFRVWHAPSGEWRDTVVRAAPIREAEGSIRKWVGMNLDVTEQRHADRRTRVLLDELQHRVKNLFANIRALHRLARRAGRDPAAMAERFEERLAALERTQDLMAERSDETVDLRTLVAAEIEALDGEDRARLTGEAVALPRRTAQGLGLIVHELVTNARKHGALSVEGGRVEVSWARVGADPPRLVFFWKERGVIVATPPEHGGFGLELIRKAGPYMTNGEGDLRFEPDGVRFALEAPLDDDGKEDAFK